MRFARVLIQLSTFSALMLAPVADASACSCPPSGPPCQNAFQVDAIFVGTVRSITPLPDDQPPPPPGSSRIPREVRVEFGEVMTFRGMTGTTAALRTPGSGPACGYEFKEGGRYLVYASRARDGAGLVTSICSRTRLLSQAADDIAFLQTLSTPGGPRARVYGTVTHWERDLATGQPINHGPVPDVVINARGGGNAFDTVTDAQGRYEVRVPPGTYEVSAWPPGRFSSGDRKYTAELRDPRSCVAADFTVRIETRLRGTVRQAAGTPVSGALVQVMAADSVDKIGNIQTVGTTTDATGSFEFTDLSPGRYVLGVDLVRRMDPKIVFPPTYHPGTADPDAATIVELGEGLRDLPPMTIPPARAERRLTGVVLFTDGGPAPGAFVSLLDGTAGWRRQVAGAIKTADDGTFSFVVHEGLDYMASASYWDEVERKQVRGIVNAFVVRGVPAPIKIVLSEGR